MRFAHGAGELHALTLARGERGAGAVEREVAQAQLLEPLDGLGHLGNDALGHRAHGLGHKGGHAGHPGRELVERHAGGLAEVHAVDDGAAGTRIEARAVAVGADVLFKELCQARKALLVLDLRERVLHRVNRVEVGKVHLAHVAGLGALIEHVVLLGRAVKNNLALLGREVAKRHIGADAHLAGNVAHELPHELLPRGNGALLDGE